MNNNIGSENISDQISTDKETIYDNFKDENIFYVVSKRKNVNYNMSKIPRMGKIEEEDGEFSQSFCIADNPLILSECISANDDSTLYFFINLSMVNFFADKMSELKLLEADGDIRDLSGKYNLFERKDLWVYFYKKNLKVYRYLFAKNEGEIIEYLSEKKEEVHPRIISSTKDIELLKDYMEKIKTGEEIRFNKIESI